MDIKHHADHESDESQVQGGVLQLEGKHDHKLSKSERVQEVDAVIARPDVTLETFAHLDIKKILLKMDLRLIPMLTLLYLVGDLSCANMKHFANSL